MKQFYKNVLFTILISVSILATAKGQALEDVVNGMRSGNVAAMSRYFDNFVTITIGFNQSAYSKTQAEMVLKDFFNKNNVKELNVMQNGTSPNNNGKYFIGTLNTSGGSYQVYVLLKAKEGNYVLQEIRFEK